MEFQGRIKKVLPLRSGTSQRGEWQALPFIFEFFEHETDRYADSVVLETFDTKVIENLKEGMEVVCGFGHRTREYEGKTYNELRLYKIESVRKAAVPQQQTQQAAAQPMQGAIGQQLAPQAQTIYPPQNQEGGAHDDLPF